MPRRFSPDSTWSTRPCPACCSSENALLFCKENVPFVECVQCRTVYVNPLPPDPLLYSLYDNLGADYFTSEQKLDLDFNPRRYWREWSAIPPKVRRGRLLDVGCATGSFLASALDNGFTYVRGIDISAPSVAYANQRVGQGVAVSGDFLARPFEADSFDVITLGYSRARG